MQNKTMMVQKVKNTKLNKLKARELHLVSVGRLSIGSSGSDMIARMMNGYLPSSWHSADSLLNNMSYKQDLKLIHTINKRRLYKVSKTQ